MNKEYYKEYYKLERNHWWFRVRERIIINRLNNVLPGKDLKILNIGVATGRSSEFLGQFGQVTSVEYDEDCSAFASEVLKTQVINASILELPFSDDQFDLVCAFDVIEHVKEDNLAVKEMVRVCKEEGIVAVTVPAFMQLWGHHDDVNFHFRRYLMKQIESLFQGYSGKSVYKSYFNSLLFFPILVFRVVSKLNPIKINRKGSGSDFLAINERSILNKIFYNLFKMEIFFLKRIRFPFGVSIFYIWKKR